MQTVWRIVWWVLGPFYRRLLPTLVVNDPWAPTAAWVRRDALGSGARQKFSWFLEGTTTVAPSTVEELCDWLAGCQYTPDFDLFHEPDFWQHPKTFEHLRKGDCEDFALWAWRKLLELNIDATFYIGRVISNPDWRSRHAWVVFPYQGGEVLFEPAAARASMLRPFNTAKQEYEPYYSVGRDCKIVACEGVIYYLQRRDGLQPRKDPDVA